MKTPKTPKAEPWYVSLVWLVIFVGLMLIPSVIASVNYSPLQTVAVMCVAVSLWMLWYSAVPRSGIMIIVALPAMLLVAMQVMVLRLLGDRGISVDMFINVKTASPVEVNDIFAGIVGVVASASAVVAVMLLYGIVSAVSGRTLHAAVRRGGLIVGCVLACLGVPAMMTFMPVDLRFEALFPANVVYNHLASSAEMSRIRAYVPKHNTDTHRLHHGTMRRTIVLVVGESSRAESWHYYNRFNPRRRLDRRPNILWLGDVLAESNSTQRCVPLMLSGVDVRNYRSIYNTVNLFERLSECGYSTGFISMQPRGNSMTDRFAESADTSVYLDGYDGRTVGVLSRMLDGTDDMFVVIHTSGSHFDYARRYPGRAKRPARLGKRYAAELRRSYDATIDYTDAVLDDIISTVESRNDCSVVIYCSDHGEDVYDDSRNRMLHASFSPTYYQLHVPAFVWYSYDYGCDHRACINSLEVNASKPLSTSTVYYLVTSLADASSRFLWLSPASTSYKPRQRYFLNGNGTALRVADVVTDNRDLLKFRMAGIEL